MVPQTPQERAAAFGLKMLRAAFKVCSAPAARGANTTPAAHACSVAAQRAALCAQAHESVRAEILEHVLSRVLTKAAASHHFVGLLHWLVRDCPQAVLEHSSTVRTSARGAAWRANLGPRPISGLSVLVLHACSCATRWTAWASCRLGRPTAL